MEVKIKKFVHDRWWGLTSGPFSNSKEKEDRLPKHG